MPFDCTPILDSPTQFSGIDGKGGEIRVFRIAAPIRSSPIPDWYMSREAVNTATAVLIRARELIADERHWCKGTLARGWFDVPVPVQSRSARRFCTIGAIHRAGRELGFPVGDACSALEWQTIRTIPYWNDARRRTHAEVIAALDAAIATLEFNTRFVALLDHAAEMRVGCPTDDTQRAAMASLDE